MKTNTRCTAPVRGHRNGTSASCPIHAPRAAFPGGGVGAMLGGPTAPHGALTSGLRANAREKAAADDSTSPEALERLAKDRLVRVRVRVANNRRAPAKALALLSEDEERSVRAAVARHSSTPVGVLVALSGGEDAIVLRRVAENPRTPPGHLTTLAGSEDYAVRLAVAGNPGAPAEALGLLALDESTMVRDAVYVRAPRRIAHALGVDLANAEAIDMLRDQEWWTMTPESPEVVLTLALHPNA